MPWRSRFLLHGAALFAVAAGGVALAADKDQALAAGEAQVKELLQLMDTDKNGKISKQEFMTFMEQEFSRLDKNKDGELDINELKGAQIRGFYGKKPGGTGGR